MDIEAEELISRMAHDLRTPLTSLRMLMDLLTEEKVGPLNDQQAKMIAQAKEDCRRMVEAVDVHVEKVKQGKMQ